MAITYERVNWEDAPSTATPWDAEHLNIMDEGIEQVTEHSSDLEETVDYLDDRQEVLERRMDLIASIPDSAVDQRTIAELKDVRIGYDGSSFSTAGNAVRGQVRDLMRQLTALVAQAQAISDRIDGIIAVPPEETEGNQELIDIRTGYDGTQYLTAGTAVREQFNAVIDKVEHTDNSIELTMAEYEALSEEEKNNGSIYFITDAGGQRDAITVRYDNEDSGLEATNLQDAVDEVAGILDTKATSSDLTTGLAGKINTVDITQSKTESSASKVPSAAVTKSLNDSITQLTAAILSGSMRDIKSPGIYYVGNSVTDKPVSYGGILVLASSGATGATMSGIYSSNRSQGIDLYTVSVINGTWTYHNILS